MAYSLYMRWSNFLLLTVMTLHELKGYKSVGDCLAGHWSLGSTQFEIPYHPGHIRINTEGETENNTKGFYCQFTLPVYKIF